MLYESEVRGLPLDGTLQQRLDAAAAQRAGEPSDQPPVSDYTVQLVRGVTDHQERIDELLTAYSEGWTLDRMPAVDRNVLRLGVYEVVFDDQVPDAVALSEAVRLVQDLSTDESPAFVNGVLGSILRNKGSIRSAAAVRRPD